MKLNKPGRQKPDRQEFLAAGEACMAVFWATQDREEKTLDSSRFLA